jgi:ankyrin repeat protein
VLLVGRDSERFMKRSPVLMLDEVLDQIDFLKFDPEFMEKLDFYLVRAVDALNVKLVRALLELGASPNALGYFSIESLLHYLAHEYGSSRTSKGEDIIKVMEELLKAGADPNISGANNLTPLQVCRSVKALELIDLLIKYGADPRGNKVV